MADVLTPHDVMGPTTPTNAASSVILALIRPSQIVELSSADERLANIARTAVAQTDRD